MGHCSSCREAWEKSGGQLKLSRRGLKECGSLASSMSHGRVRLRLWLTLLAHS